MSYFNMLEEVYCWNYLKADKKPCFNKGDDFAQIKKPFSKRKA